MAGAQIEFGSYFYQENLILRYGAVTHLSFAALYALYFGAAYAVFRHSVLKG